jgi:Tfp pilus assembly protein PilF
MLLFPAEAGLWRSLGVAQAGQGKSDEAVKSFEKAIELDPNLAGAHYNLATVYLNLGDLKRGWKEYEWRW